MQESDLALSSRHDFSIIMFNSIQIILFNPFSLFLEGKEESRKDSRWYQHYLKEAIIHFILGKNSKKKKKGLLSKEDKVETVLLRSPPPYDFQDWLF